MIGSYNNNFIHTFELKTINHIPNLIGNWMPELWCEASIFAIKAIADHHSSSDQRFNGQVLIPNIIN